MPDEPPHTNDRPEDDLRAASQLEKADVDLGTRIAKHRDEPLARAAGDASKIGDQGPLYALSAAVAMAGVVARNRRLAGSGVLMFGAVGVADLAKRLTKRLVRRTRPHVLLDHARYERDAGGSGDKPEQSFPSGHTACSVAAARGLSRNFPAAGAIAGLAAVGIGISRVAKGAHWPLDVIGGAVIGLAAEAAAVELLELALRNADGLVASDLLPIVRPRK